MRSSGTLTSTGRLRIARGRLAFVLAFALLAQAGAAFGGFFTGPNAGSVGGITASTQTVDAANAALPVFNAAGQLQNIGALPGGAGYGTLGQTAVNNVSTVGGGVAAPAAPLGGVSGFQPPVATPLGQFGDTIGGAASLRASTFNGGAGSGIFWAGPNFVADSGPIPQGTAGRASVETSRGFASFNEVGGSTGSIPFVNLAISGTLGNQGPNGAFVAASLTATFNIFNAAGALTSTFNSAIIIVSDGTGPRGDFVDDFSSTGTFGTLSSGFFTPGANSFFAYGAERLPSVPLPAGGFVTYDATLTLVADPDVTLTLSDDSPFVPLGDFGASASIPEPASFAMVGLGLLCVSCAARHARSKAKP